VRVKDLSSARTFMHRVTVTVWATLCRVPVMTRMKPRSVPDIGPVIS